MIMFETGLAFALALLIALVHFLGEELNEYISGYRSEIVSVASGASITYIFLELMPEFYRVAARSTELIFVFPLLGFSSIHLLEKYIAQAGFDQGRMRRDYGGVHSVFLFIYYAALGYLASSLLAQNSVSGLLFFLPIILHVAVSSFSITKLHEDFVGKTAIKLAVSSAPVIGVILHKFRIISTAHFNPIFGVVTGMFLYVAVRDSMPAEDEGSLWST